MGWGLAKTRDRQPVLAPATTLLACPLVPRGGDTLIWFVFHVLQHSIIETLATPGHPIWAQPSWQVWGPSRGWGRPSMAG